MYRIHQHHNRQSYRLRGWDYRNPGLYFITICTRNRQPHFGEIQNGFMGLSIQGCVAWHFWRQIPIHHDNVILDAFVVMPNHVHGIMGITDQDGRAEPMGMRRVGTLHATSLPSGVNPQLNAMSDISPKSGSLSVIVRSYKSAVTRWCRRNGYADFAWQPRFYDHIIRNEQSYQRIVRYVRNNPKRWGQDRYYR